MVLLDQFAVLDEHLVHHPVDPGEHVPPLERFQGAVGLQLEVGRPKRQHQHQRQDDPQNGERLGQGPRAQYPAGFAQQTPQRHEEQVLMFHGVGQRGGAVAADHLHPLHHARRYPAVLDLLDDQRPHRRFRVEALLGIVFFFFRPRASQRQHGHRLRVRFVDVLLHGVFDLGGHVSGVAGVPDRIAGGHHRRGQLVQQPHGIGPLVEQVLAADGLDPAPLAPAQRHADPIAIDQPPPLIGDRIGGIAGIEAGVNRVREIFQPGPEDLAIGEVAKLVTLQKVAGQLAHLHQEPQVPLLDVEFHRRSLEDLHHPHRLQVSLQRPQHQQAIGGVGGLPVVFVAATRMWRHEHPLAAGEGLLQQSAVPGLVVFVIAEPGFLDVDLILQRQPALVVDRPDRSADRRQRRNHLCKELAVKLLRCNARLRQLGNLAHQRADLLLGLFNQFGIERLFGTHVPCLPLFRSILKGNSAPQRWAVK